MLLYTHIKSPVGRLKLVASGPRLIAVLWPDDGPLRIRLDDMREGSVIRPSSKPNAN